MKFKTAIIMKEEMLSFLLYTLLHYLGKTVVPTLNDFPSNSSFSLFKNAE